MLKLALILLGGRTRHILCGLFCFGFGGQGTFDLLSRGNCVSWPVLILALFVCISLASVYIICMYVPMCACVSVCACVCVNAHVLLRYKNRMVISAPVGEP